RSDAHGRRAANRREEAAARHGAIAAAAQGARHRTSPGFLKILIIPEALLLEMGSTEVPLPVAVPSPEITAVNEGSAPAAPSTDSKPKKKICPDTKRLRDECIVEHGESACTKWIEAHKRCLRAEGFNV
ncbi:unnamed protein product, partial [Urochloa humidicola]